MADNKQSGDIAPHHRQLSSSSDHTRRGTMRMRVVSRPIDCQQLCPATSSPALLTRLLTALRGTVMFLLLRMPNLTIGLCGIYPCKFHVMHESASDWVLVQFDKRAFQGST